MRWYGSSLALPRSVPIAVWPEVRVCSTLCPSMPPAPRTRTRVMRRWSWQTREPRWSIQAGSMQIAGLQMADCRWRDCGWQMADCPSRSHASAVCCLLSAVCCLLRYPWISISTGTGVSALRDRRGGGRRIPGRRGGGRRNPGRRGGGHPGCCVPDGGDGGEHLVHLDGELGCGRAAHGAVIGRIEADHDVTDLRGEVGHLDHEGHVPRRKGGRHPADLGHCVLPAV